MSKGSRQRPAVVSDDEIRHQWNKIFPNAAPVPQYVTRRWYERVEDKKHGN